VLRNNIEKLTPLGIEAETYIRKGALVPDDSMIKCILEEMKDVNGSFLLDGFPRTKTQAEKLWQVQEIDSVINLVVPYEIIIGKIQPRASSISRKISLYVNRYF
jgi:adenylate kinase family enzyme